MQSRVRMMREAAGGTCAVGLKDCGFQHAFCLDACFNFTGGCQPEQSVVNHAFRPSAVSNLRLPMPRGRPKGSKSKGKVGRPRKISEEDGQIMARISRKRSEASPPRERKSALVKQGKLTAAQVGPLIAKVSAVCDSVLLDERSRGGSKLKSAIRVFTNELRRQMLSLGDEYMGSSASERQFLQLSRDRASLQKALLSASKHVNDTRWGLRRVNQQQKTMVDGQADLQELQNVLRDFAGMKDAPSRGDTPVQDGTDIPEQLGFLRHVNVYSHIAAVASLSRSHDRLKTANDQIAALIAVLPRAARQLHSDVSNMSSQGTEV